MVCILFVFLSKMTSLYLLLELSLTILEIEFKAACIFQVIQVIRSLVIIYIVDFSFLIV